MRLRKWRRFLANALAVWVFSGVCCLWAQKPKPTEYQVKAAYLSNFGRFVDWPAAATSGDGPFNVCVLGQDPLGASLDAAIAGEKIGSAKLAAKRVSRVEDAGDCRLLFISSSEESRLAAILAAVGKNILTVGDMPEFAERGGMIQFVLDGSRVRFEINLIAAQRAGLNLGSELLKLATTVRRNP